MDADDLRRRLADPFPAHVLGFKAQAAKNNRALCVAYIDARDVMDRLDDVFGVDGWEDNYTPLPDGVLCTLRVKVGDAWVQKQDVGSPSEQPDAGDRNKAAVSDALKRAAVKLGVGRYLYSLDLGWVDYDPAKKQIVGRPTVPAWALPGGSGRPHQAPARAAPPQPPHDAEVGKAMKLPLYDDYDDLRDGLRDATDPHSLKEAFRRVFKAHEAKQITDDQYRDLTSLKDALKAELQPAK